MSIKTGGFDQIVQTVAAAISGSRRIAVLSGAGMSADSGLPTYRGIGGLYNEMEVEEGMPIEDILHAYTFAGNPALTWKYLAQIERACRGAAPNHGHRLLAAWEHRFEVCLVTQTSMGSTVQREAPTSSNYTATCVGSIAATAAIVQWSTISIC